MKRFFIGLLNGYRRFRLWRLRLRGRTPADEAERRIADGSSWDEFCDTLKAAGAAVVHPGAPGNAFDQAEGYRYLSRLTRAGLEAFVEYADPAFPRLRRMVHETVKMGADNPDNWYENARISGEFDYRIQGNRGSVHYLGFYTQRGDYGSTGGLQPSGALEASDMRIEADGSFEILLSREPVPGKNWLKLDPDSSMLIVRQTFLDRERETLARVGIECLGGPEKPEPLTAEALDEGLGRAGMLVAGASLLFARWAKGFQGHANELPLFDPEVSNAAGGDANLTYYHSYWQLANDEALVIEVQPPECPHWNFQLNNHWMESLDYRYHMIHVNKHTATYRPDGSVRIVVAHSDPGLPNWIETTGHRQGTMCFRWFKAEDKPQPVCRVLPFEALKTLPE